MILERLTVGPFAENCYVVGVPPAVAIVDPGGESDRLFALVERRGWTPEAILLTHGHLDHIAHCAHVAERWNLDLWVHPDDVLFLRSKQMPAFWDLLEARPCPEPSFFFEDGGTWTGAGLTLRILHTPGHTPGGVCLIDEASRSILAGDTLFHRGIGRTDLPGGDSATLERSIREKLFALPGDWRVWPGHGPETSLDDERRENPFFGARAGRWSTI